MMNSKFAPWAEGERPNVVAVCSADGLVTVSLQRALDGVFVRRTLLRGGGARVIQTARFNTAQEFHRWCEADAARFNDPLLSAKVVRYGIELFREIDAAACIG